MTDESFILVSLKEDQAKQLAQVISNDSCRKILDYLSKKKESTETEIAKELKIPISTVHYNLQHLSKNKLVETNEYHYSKKGREVIHYKLANRLIIIAPKETSTKFLDKLKKIIPVVAIIGVGTVAVHFISKQFAQAGVTSGENMMLKTAPTAADNMAGARLMAEAAPQIAISNPWWQTLEFWFLIGGVFSIILMLIFYKIKEKK